jgi:hypothetical protein
LNLLLLFLESSSLNFSFWNFISGTFVFLVTSTPSMRCLPAERLDPGAGVTDQKDFPFSAPLVQFMEPATPFITSNLPLFFSFLFLYCFYCAEP